MSIRLRIRKTEPHRRRHVRHSLQSKRHKKRQSRCVKKGANGARKRRSACKWPARDQRSVVMSSRKYRSVERSRGGEESREHIPSDGVLRAGSSEFTGQHAEPLLRESRQMYYATSTKRPELFASKLHSPQRSQSIQLIND